MDQLTSRQIQILKAIIEEYIETAEAVGSETLEKKYSLGVSPATIRNEMVALTNMKYLKQPHKSAGRVPTSMSLKYYVKNILKPQDLPVSEEVSVKQKIWDYRNEFDRMLNEATRTLAQKSKALALATTDTGNFYQAGVSNILDFPEFYDIDLTKTVLSLLDKMEYWQGIAHRVIGEDPYYLLVGDEMGESDFESCSFLYTKYHTPSQSGVIGIVGPYRLDYGRLIPVVRYFGELLTEIGR